jgi:hypothetical protein
MDEEYLRIRQKLKDDFVHYAAKCLTIRSDEGFKKLVLNQEQLYLHNLLEDQRRKTGRVRAIIVKGRQIGCSTYIEGRYYWRSTHSLGSRAFILTHDVEATNNLFDMVQRYHEHCPQVVRPTIEASNAKELIFAGLDSGYKVGTAGNQNVGRSSTIQLLHGSEVAFWPHAAEHAKGILQAVPNVPGTEIILESTANGNGNYFHEQWQLAISGESDFIGIYIPWFWKKSYSLPIGKDFILTDEEKELVNLYNLSLENIHWRRKKILEFTTAGRDGTKSFMQEYPCNAVEAFQTTGEDNFITPHEVMKARLGEAEPYGKLIVGVDPARFGDDKTSIYRRRGRVAYNPQSYKKKDTMEVTGIVHRIIIDEQPDKVVIDIGGLGAGIYDRLCELGHKEILMDFNGGATPLDQKKYFNKRAEVWGLMKEWLLDTPCKIPDNDSLHADLCGIKYRYDSNTRLVLEKKEDMKKRGIKSPDEGDALAMTFAVPNSALNNSRAIQDNKIAKDMMSNYRHIDRLKRNAYER